MQSFLLKDVNKYFHILNGGSLTLACFSLFKDQI